MTEPHSKPTPGFDFEVVGRSVTAFLTPRCNSNSLISDEKFIDGVCACIAFLLSEVLELAHNDSGGSQLVLKDIRITVCSHSEHKVAFQYSKVFWKGSG